MIGTLEKMMAWNEPGSGNRDPWKNRKDSTNLDDVLRRLRDGFGRLFGGSGGSGAGGGGSPAHSGSILLILAAVAIVWIAFDSWTVIDARQIGVVLRFGQFNRVMTNGLNLKWPAPIERVIHVDATSVQSVSDSVRMLTKDENIVQIDFNVQYQISDAKQYLFAVSKADDTLKQAAESAVRQVIGRSDMDTVLSSHGSDLVTDTEKLLQQILDSYNIGMHVTAVNFVNLLPPHEVKDAFDDVNNASNNQKQLINDAQATAAKIVPLARGEAARILAEAQGYKAAHIAAATGDAQRFSLIEAQYRAAPDVTRKRLYLDTMQQVLGHSQKVVDQSGGKSILYLPLDKARSDAAAASAVIASQAERVSGGSQ
jgi:modulator of FtsH protease HflK